ncbi:unannotated protein [freshwater metagenome]|uniref:Unannotated protein n=2 Tax=freshwater metagenome TaxID=449393 RepID=A0A6J7AGX2_9ZZZZ
MFMAVCLLRVRRSNSRWLSAKPLWLLAKLRGLFTKFGWMPSKFRWLLAKLHGLPALLRQDRGNVESAMVLIPLLILFLTGIQLIIATNIRNGDLALAQSQASTRAISGQINLSDEVIELDSPDPFTHIRLLVTSRRSLVPSIVPGLIELLGGTPTTDVKGVAVMEEVN